MSESAFDRRTFLARTAQWAGIGAAGGFLADGFIDLRRPLRVDPTPPGAPPKSLTPAEWRTLAAAQARLLPTDDLGPGATEVNAIGYLDAALADESTTPDRVALVKDGALKLDQRAQQRDVEHFGLLGPREQDEAIRLFETREGGRSWLRTLLAYTLEAFFGDPMRGANPGEIGWQWAGHRPGFPRPTEPGWEPKERHR